MQRITDAEIEQVRTEWDERLERSIAESREDSQALRRRAAEYREQAEGLELAAMRRGFIRVSERLEQAAAARDGARSER